MRTAWIAQACLKRTNDPLTHARARATHGARLMTTSERYIAALEAALAKARKEQEPKATPRSLVLAIETALARVRREFRS